MSLYIVRRLGVHSFRMVKLDDDWNVEAIYILVERSPLTFSCDCFQKDKHECRHRRMMELFIQTKDRINTGWLYDYERKAWEPPIGGYLRAMRNKRRV